MQTLFSYQRSKEAGVELAEDEIAKTYEEEIHNTLLEEQKPIFSRIKEVKSTFRKVYKDHPPKFENLEGSDREAFLNGLNFYRNHLLHERVHYKKVMMNELSKSYAIYLKLLMLPGEFAVYVAKDRQRKKALKNGSKLIEGEFNLENNFFVNAINKSERFKAASEKYNATWAGSEDHIISWYKEILKTNSDYQTYQKKHSPTLEEDLEMIRIIYRDVIFGNDVLNAFLEEEDMWWSENRHTMKSMIKKTIKQIDASDADAVNLVELLINEEEDLEFFEELYKYTLDADEDFEEIIGEKAKNWDKERVAVTDKIILKMAMAELINFPSIPVKVTINEYIELSKVYSTPKSKQFVNGLLDKISEEWLASGKIQKSGRGLIDNK